jgi:hypothetical protein
MLQALLLSAALQPAPVAVTPTLRGWPLLNEISRRAVRFFWNESDPNTGFTKDRAANFATTDPYFVSNIASTGFALAAMAIGTERKWLNRQAALERVRTTLRSFETRTTRTRGWFYHWINFRTGAREWNSEVSSIDTSILLSGMIVAERYFRDPEVSQRLSRILGAVDWQWMLTNGGTMPDALTFSMGWIRETGWITARWDNYSEEAMIYILAYGSYPGMPAGSWAAIQRPVVTYGGMQTIRGGPLFVHHMSNVFYDFRNRRCPLGFDYWVASRNAALMQRRWAMTNAGRFVGYGPNFWARSAADGPDGYTAYGMPGWGDEDGTIAPNSAVASMPFTPVESLRSAEHILATYPRVWGRYGFAVSLNPTRKWQSPDVIGIELGMALLGIENHRDRFAWRMTMAHPVVQAGFRRIGLNVTNEGPSEGRPLRIAP